MLGLIVLLTIFGSLADLARRQERRARDLAERGPDAAAGAIHSRTTALAAPGQS